VPLLYRKTEIGDRETLIAGVNYDRNMDYWLVDSQAVEVVYADIVSRLQKDETLDYHYWQGFPFKNPREIQIERKWLTFLLL